MAGLEVKPISLKIDGLNKDKGAVRLSVFREKVDQLSGILADAERQAAHVGQAKSNFRITDLHQSSAFLEAEPYQDGDYEGSIIATHFLHHVVSGINEQVEALDNVASSLIRKIQDLCAGSGDRFEKGVLVLGGETYDLGAELAAKAQKYLDKKYSAKADVKGILGRVNVHDRNDFYIYPEFSDGSVICHFDAEELMQKVRNSLGRVVIANGIFDYIGSDVDPVSGYITEIDMMPDEYEAPSTEELFGVAPNISGDADITDYIGDIRDEWEQH